MDEGALLEVATEAGATPAEGTLPPRIGPKRLRHPVRNQIEFQQCSLDELLPEEHEARAVWEYPCPCPWGPWGQSPWGQSAFRR